MLRAAVPEPLVPNDESLVLYEWIKMPDSSGFGSYTESGMVIPCRFQGTDMSFVAQMYLDDDPPIVAGREIWGFPKKYAHPKLEVVKDTLTGTLEYAGQLVAMGTMGYKHESMAGNGERTTAILSKTQVNLKIIPGEDGKHDICQLVAYNLTDISVTGSWIGPGRQFTQALAQRCARFRTIDVLPFLEVRWQRPLRDLLEMLERFGNESPRFGLLCAALGGFGNEAVLCL